MRVIILSIKNVLFIWLSMLKNEPEYLVSLYTEMLNIVELNQTLISYEFNKYKLSLYNVCLLYTSDAADEEDV